MPHGSSGSWWRTPSPCVICILCVIRGGWHSVIVEQDVGDTVVWVGFELLHRTRQLGIFQRRAERFTRWTQETAAASTVHLVSFGRPPFQGPLHKFLTMHPRHCSTTSPPLRCFHPPLPCRPSHKVQALPLRSSSEEVTSCGPGRCTSKRRAHRYRGMLTQSLRRW